jgi:group I intron endonuclease
MAFVYLHTNLQNGKVYVGQTWQSPVRRWGVQQSSALQKTATSRYLNSAIRKYGWQNFEHQILAETENQARLDNLEKVWIILLQSRNAKFGYNLQAGGSKGRQSEETRKIISEYQKTHENAGRFRLGTPPPNKGKIFRHRGSFGQGHAPYCNHLGGFNGGNICSRCGKENQHV